jgi:O-antigen/teichoic acid export membrane protein
VKGYLGQAGWVSVAQVAQVFLSGSDLLLLGAVLGATSVVQYSCTGKLSVVLSNHPQLIMQAATPALSEMRASGRRQDLLNVSVALMLAMLTLSGFVACVILALNGSFVHWWVGPDQYGGQRLTLVFTALLVLRHFNITLIYGLFCFGQERRISLTNLADGAVGLCAGFFLIRGLGAEGAALGSLVAVMLVSLPANLVALARETGTTVPALTGKLWPWLWRFATIGTVCAALPFIWAPRGASGMIVVGLAVLATYGIVMAQGLWHGPLGTYARPRLAQFVPVWWRGLPSSARP